MTRLLAWVGLAALLAAAYAAGQVRAEREALER